MSRRGDADVDDDNDDVDDDNDDDNDDDDVEGGDAEAEAGQDPGQLVHARQPSANGEK